MYLTKKHICCLLFTKYNQFVIETKHNNNQLVRILKEKIKQYRAALGLDAGVDLSSLYPILTIYLTNKEYIVKELTPDHGPQPM